MKNILSDALYIITTQDGSNVVVGPLPYAEQKARINAWYDHEEKRLRTLTNYIPTWWQLRKATAEQILALS